jgi:uncharacterized protein DUF6924
MQVKSIPETEDALVLRTDFSNSAAWDKICAAIREPVGVEGFQAYVEFVSDPEYDGASVEQVLSAIPKDYDHSFLFIVDQMALNHAEQPVLVLDLESEPGQTFRAIPSQMSAVENNLSIANMDFEDFTEATDPDGIFRGFNDEA